MINSWILFSVAVGGGLGAVLRYLAVQFVETPSGFPLATLIVNVLGSFLIGICFVVFLEKGLISEFWRPALMAGFLGGLTTFSAFSLEAVYMLEDGRWQMALAYVVMSLILCILAAFGGMQLVRSL